MGSLIDDLHSKGQANNFLRYALLSGDKIAVYIPGEFAKEAAKESLRILAESLEEEGQSFTLKDVDYKIKVGKSPGLEGQTDKEGRTIVRFSGYSRL